MRRRNLVLLFVVQFFLVHINAQTYSTLKGQVEFNSVAAEESIAAKNYSVAAQLIYNSGKGQFIIPVKSFNFKNALMEEHFNENYMETDTYPKATYKYTVVDVKSIDINKPGKYAVNTSGVITVKNVTKNIEVPGYIVVIDENTIRLDANFVLLLSEYNIAIPKLVEKKIAQEIKINVSTTLNRQ